MAKKPDKPIRRPLREPKDQPHFSRRMKSLREKLGLDFAQLEEVSGITDQTLINIERYGREPRISTAAKIARALGVSVGEMIEG